MTAFNLYLARFVTPQYTLSGMIADAPRFTVPPVTEPRTSAMTPPTSALTGAARYDAQDLRETNPPNYEMTAERNHDSLVEQGSRPASFNEVWSHYASVYGFKGSPVSQEHKKWERDGVSEGGEQIYTDKGVQGRFARFAGKSSQYTYFTTIRENLKAHRVIFDTVRVAR